MTTVATLGGKARGKTRALRLWEGMQLVTRRIGTP